jgi:hypothetical protein
MDLRNAQGLTLGFGRLAASAAGTLTATLMRSSLLQDLVVSTPRASASSLINEIRVAGQNLNVSSVGAGAMMWHPTAQVEGHRSLGIPLEQNLTVAIDCVSGAAVDWTAGIGTDPVPEERIVSVDELGDALDYYGGLGTANIGAGASATLTTTIRRPCTLGLLSMCFDLTTTEGDVVITSIQLNNIELLSGGTTAATRAVPIESLAYTCTDIDGRVIGMEASPNSVLTVAITNNGVAAFDISGGFFTLPDVG